MGGCLLAESPPPPRGVGQVLWAPKVGASPSKSAPPPPPPAAAQKSLGPASARRADIPQEDSIFEYRVDVKTGAWSHWNNYIPTWSYPGDDKLEFSTLFISTLDSARLLYITECNFLQKRAVLLMGGAGTAKTVTIEQFLTGFQVPGERVGRRGRAGQGRASIGIPTSPPPPSCISHRLDCAAAGVRTVIIRQILGIWYQITLI